MSAPTISVVVPCRNEARSLVAALDALEGQDFPRHRFEILVVDGGSTDGSCDIAGSRGVRLLADRGRGPGAARNVGVRAARGEIVAFTDADCMPRPDWLTSIAEVFAEQPNAAGVAGSLRMPRHTLLGRLEDNDALAHYAGTITSNVAYRRDVLLEVGGFAEELLCCEDGDLAWRVQDAGHRIVHDRRPVVTHAPPEVGGSLAPYLGKQLWYARHDVIAHARAVRRVVHRRPQLPQGSAAGALDALRSLENVAWLGVILGGVAVRAPVVAGLGAAALLTRAAKRAAEAAREAGDVSPRVLVAATAIDAAKSVLRGAGTLLGLADLARPSRRELVRLPAAASLAPRAPVLPARLGALPRAAG